MRFREATPKDAGAIAVVRMATWRHNYEDVVDPRLLATLDPDDERARWESRLGATAEGPARLHVTVAEHDGRILGFAATLAASREPDVEERTGELAALDVHPVAQGAGLGSQLLERAVDGLRGLGAIHATLRVLRANDHGRAFFDARGWSVDADAPAEAPDGGPAGPTERRSRRL